MASANQTTVKRRTRSLTAGLGAVTLTLSILGSLPTTPATADVPGGDGERATVGSFHLFNNPDEPVVAQLQPSHSNYFDDDFSTTDPFTVTVPHPTH